MHDRQNNITRVFLGSVPLNHKGDAKDTVGAEQQTFNHQYSKKYPSLCREFVIVAATHSIELKHSISAVRSTLQSIDMFFKFLELECLNAKSFRDICTDVMLEYRAYIRSLSFSNSSSYKSTFYNPIKNLLSSVMGTSRGPQPFDIPIYQVDSYDQELLPTYSDMVMYQLIGAAYYESSVIMDEYKKFNTLVDKGSLQFRITREKRSLSWNLENFGWFFVNVLKLNRPPYTQEFRNRTKINNFGSVIKNRFGLSTLSLIKSKNDDEWKAYALKGKDPRYQFKNFTNASIPDLAATWRSEASFLTHNLVNLGSNTVSQYYNMSKFNDRDDLSVFLKPPFSEQLGHSFTQREVACRNTLLPFFILFSIYTGRNTEVMLTWKRVTSKGKCILSLDDNADPLNTNAILLEGWKYRGKRKVKEKDDVSIEVADLLYTLLKFVLEYTKPLADFLGTDDIWLYLSLDTKICVRNFHNNYRESLKVFCKRNTVLNESGNLHLEKSHR